jgi:hypothetical protein
MAGRKGKSKKSHATKNNLTWRRWARRFRAILIGVGAFAANVAVLWDHIDHIAALWDHIRLVMT